MLLSSPSSSSTLPNIFEPFNMVNIILSYYHNIILTIIIFY
jgi:hypothetical protein